MSGAKTRFGFAGDGSEPPDSDRGRGSPTIIGHDIHLPVHPAFSSPTNTPSAPPPRARVPPTPTPRFASPVSRSAIPYHLTEEATDELPSRRRRTPRQSRLARFLGRWTKSGRFVSDSRGPGRGGDGYSRVAHDPLARNVVLVLVVALVTFLLTLLGMKTRQHFASKPSQPTVPAAAPAQTAGDKALPQNR